MTKRASGLFTARAGYGTIDDLERQGVDVRPTETGWVTHVQARFFLSTLLVALTNGAAPAEQPDYLKQVKPLLAARCASCHGALAQKAKLRLDTAALIKKGGRNGPAISGKSGESLLIRAVLGE